MQLLIPAWDACFWHRRPQICSQTCGSISVLDCDQVWCDLNKMDGCEIYYLTGWHCYQFRVINSPTFFRVDLLRLWLSYACSDDFCVSKIKSWCIFPSNHCPETSELPMRFAAYFCNILCAALTYTIIWTVEFSIETAINLQRKCLSIPDFKHMEKIFVDLIFIIGIVAIFMWLIHLHSSELIY